ARDRLRSGPADPLRALPRRGRGEPTAGGDEVMRSWWSGAWLVLERGLMENLRSKTFRVVTALLLLASAAAVTAPQLLGGTTPTYALATVGEPPAELVTAMEAAGRSGDFHVRF